MAVAAEKAIRLGHPSYIWRRGQDRRLNLIRQHVALDGRRILDVGCGIGMYVEKFRRFSSDVYGVDVDPEKVIQASRSLPNISEAPAEALPFEDGMFDVIMLHEVIEHVDDDRRSIEEAVRCLKPGGQVIIFAPNRLYLFETHGFYFLGRYYFKLLPLVNYLPDGLRDSFCPHVRIYRGRDIRKLFDHLPVKKVFSSYIFPGLDNIAERYGWFGRAAQAIVDVIESTPLRCFGISHFVVYQKSEA
ncbi:MAG: class I SAM-dependent methyltransferase [Chloroflexota bacterium]